MPVAAPPLAQPGWRDVARRLAWYQYGRRDPTTRVRPTSFARATWTPDGPATVVTSWSSGALRTQGWGPGAGWAEAASHRMAALDVPVAELLDGHRLVVEAARRHPGVYAGASGNLFHELLPTILAQRITAGEAVRQWWLLCARLGRTAPGPELGLRLPPAPDDLAHRPTWWFHPLGIEAKRADALRSVAAVADRLWEWAELSPGDAADRLGRVRGIGPWTIGSVLGPALGDDDAVAVGDYHLPHLVAWNLAREARADDARMLALLEPYRGQRGRVIRLLSVAGRRAPSFGPRHRILPMHQW